MANNGDSWVKAVQINCDYNKYLQCSRYRAMRIGSPHEMLVCDSTTAISSLSLLLGVPLRLLKLESYFLYGAYSNKDDPSTTTPKNVLSGWLMVSMDPYDEDWGKSDEIWGNGDFLVMREDQDDLTTETVELLAGFINEVVCPKVKMAERLELDPHQRVKVMEDFTAAKFRQWAAAREETNLDKDEEEDEEEDKQGED